MSIQDFLQKTISQIRSQYILGFNPSNPGENGSFHELTVRLANKERCPTCRIKARRGYYAGISSPRPASRRTPEEPSLSWSELDKQIIQRMILLTVNKWTWNMDELAFELKHSEKIKNSQGQPQVMFELSIDPSGIDTLSSVGKHSYNMQAAIFSLDNDGNGLDSNIWKFDGSLSDEQYAMKQRIPFSTKIPLLKNAKKFQIVVYDEKSGKMASRYLKKAGKGFAFDNNPPWFLHY
jgi:hypothetical protein